MEKFTRFFPDSETVEDWMQTWGEELGGLEGEEIKHGLFVLARDNPWPPTMAEFIEACKSFTKPILPMIEAPKHGKSEYQAECMAKLRHLIDHPKKPGPWWKQEVLDKYTRGEKVSLTAWELAK